MTLDDLLDGDEYLVSEWLSEYDLIHSCDCGYTVYDPDAINEVIQTEWGDDRCDEIYDWACNLSNRYGWMFLESSNPKYQIYHCQYCNESELSLMLDMERIASASNEDEQNANEVIQGAKLNKTPKEHLIIYVDESYTNGFPRKEGGSLAYAALITPESAIGHIEDGTTRILEECYRGSPPSEIKYSKIVKRPRLLESVGPKIVDLMNHTPDSAVIGLFVPRDGYFGEKLRSIEAIAKYEDNKPNLSEIEDVNSDSSVELAVREAANILAQNIAVCIANYIAYLETDATIIFDPRTVSLDQPLANALKDFLPRIPINIPVIRHGEAIVTVRPDSNMEALGNRVECKFGQHSHECHGLQIADFLAGDIRTFFEETQQLLDYAISTKPLINKRVLFPQVFNPEQIDQELMKKVYNRTGKSFLPLYRGKLVNGLISYYTRNGQMRNMNTNSGEVYDLVD